MTTNVTAKTYSPANYAPQNAAAKQAETTAPAASTPNAPSTPANTPAVSFRSSAEHRSQNTMFLLERMFGDQAGVSQRARQRGAEDSSPFVAGSIAEYLSTLTVEQAQEYVADDGFWGVERTAERLFDMAYSLSGGDPDMMEKMRDAVNRGFEAAERAWGNDLPEISHNTLSRTMEMFENWFNERNQEQAQ